MPKVCVVVTDGVSNDRYSTVSAADSLKADGVSVYVVGAGSGVDQDELEAMASLPVST
jgi:hypothetical protein